MWVTACGCVQIGAGAAGLRGPDLPAEQPRAIQGAGAGPEGEAGLNGRGQEVVLRPDSGRGCQPELGARRGDREPACVHPERQEGAVPQPKPQHLHIYP